MSYKKAAEIKRQPTSIFKYERLPDFGWKVPLRPFQVQGMFYMEEAKKCILADSTGLGKTAQCIALFQWLEQYRKVSDNRWILVVPPTCILQWSDEFEKFSELPAPVLGIYGRRERIAAYTHGFWQFMIVSYQVLIRDWEMINGLGIKNWVLDDAHFFRHHNTQTARVIKYLVKDADRVVLTTATPMQKDPRDLHSLLEALGLNSYFGSLTGFTNHYCIIRRTRKQKRDGTFYPSEEFLGIRNREELKRKIKPFVIMRTFKDVGDELPALTVKPIFLNMSDQQTRLYNQLKHRILRAYDSGEMSDVEILNTGFHTMRKICAGTKSLKMKEDVSVKLDAVVHFVQNRLGREKMLIYSYYKDTIRAVIGRLKGIGREDYATFTGDETSKTYREEVKKKFLNPSSGLNILVGTDALRVGLNLQSARYIIMIDLIMNAQEMKQLVGRIRRIGGKPHVVVYPLITKGTLEESLYRSLQYESALFGVLFDQKEEFFPKLSAVQLATLLRK
jgi:SNF2 family DNA or RNA helicase